MSSTPLKVLIIDDNEMTRALLNVILRSDDFDVVGEATDAQSGLAQAKKLHPDVVLLDIVMPGTNGLDVIRPIKAILPNAMVLMVTGVDDADSVKEAIQSGANGFIVKPFNTASVIGTMSKVREKFTLAAPVSLMQRG